MLSLAVATTLFTVHRGRKLESARLAAQARVDEALPKVALGLDALAKEVAAKAQQGVQLEAIGTLLSEVTSQSDLEQLAKTVADFDHEPWFSPYANLGPHAFFVGQTLVSSSEPGWGEPLAPLVETATSSGTASAVLARGGTPFLVGLARSAKTTPQQQPAVLALAQPLTPDLLASVTAPLRVSALVAAGAGPGVGSATGVEAALTGEARGEPCCARKALGPTLTLSVHRDPGPDLAAAASEASGAAPLYFGVGALLALAALIFAFRTRDAHTESAALLRETAAQLKQSQEQLQRLSRQIELNASDRFQVPPEAPGDALASTQASVQSSRYEVVAPLGEGGMARVSVATVRGAEGFRRTFVLKRLRPELAANQELVGQFIDEARLGASLVHSNIVPVFDFGRDAEGYYLAQEFILGRDVGAVIEGSMARRGRALEPALVALVAREALEALGYAHSKHNEAGRPLGLVHRDVSPNNLMVSARGEVKLLDFGIVKSDDRVTRTQAGVVKGNLFFMSPEQARAMEVDARSDLFSLGLVMSNALLGRPLYDGNTVLELMQRAALGPTAADRQRVQEGAGPLAEVVLRALSLEPAERYPDAAAFSRALVEAGAIAAKADLQALMDSLFAADFANERQKFQVGS